MKVNSNNAPHLFCGGRIKIITALFEEGLDTLHLRKPGTAPMFAERLLTLIPEQYHKRIVVHGHFYLK